MVAQAALRERLKAKRRSSKWPKFEHSFLKTHKNCAACGGTKRLQVHHISPFRLHPERELDVNNVIVLCMGMPECHLRIGHGNSFKSYNPHVTEDAAVVLLHPETRRTVENLAKAKRLT